MPDPLLNGFTVGPYRVMPRQNRLEGPSGSHHVEPRVMEVLLALAARPGELVTRQTLLDEVWADVVVLDETLTKSIQVLRGYFNDKPSDPKFIRTVPRRGYELIAPVELLRQDPEESTPIDGAQAPGADPAKAATRPVVTPSSQPRQRGWRWFAAGAGVLVVLAVGIYLTMNLNRDTVTLAVIPPVQPGESGDLGFVSEGLADYLIDQFSQARRLEVVARRSSFGMRDTDTNVRAIGEQLGAEYLIEGSLREDRDGLLLTLFLVSTDSGTNVWTTRLRGSVDDISSLQRRAAGSLRSALRDHLGIAVGAVEDAQAAIPELAYRKFLEARYQWTLRGERRIDRSIELLEEALAIAPDYAAAHMAYAQSVAVKPFYTNEPVASQFERARESTSRALELDPALAANVAALEGFMLFKERQWARAQESLLRALDLAPDNVNALYWYSWFLSQIGRYDEALEHLLKAHQLDPVSAVVNDRLAIAYVWAGNLQAAAERYRVAVDLGYLESTQPLSLMLFLYRTRQFDALAELLLRIGGRPVWVVPTIDALQNPDQRERASELIDSLPESDPVLDTARFGIWMLFGQTDRAFRDFDPGPKSPYVEALWSDDAAHLRADPRFDQLLSELGFTGEDRDLLPDTDLP